MKVFFIRNSCFDILSGPPPPSLRVVRPLRKKDFFRLPLNVVQFLFVYTNCNPYIKLNTAIFNANIIFNERAFLRPWRDNFQV